MMAKTAEQVPCVTYLHHQCWHAAGSRSNTHRHAHWQFEFIASGSVEVVRPRGAVDLQAGAAVLIAPGLQHAFRHPLSGCRFVSVKFDGPPAQHGQQLSCFPVDHPCAAIGLALYRLCSGAPLVARGKQRQAIEHLMGAALMSADAPDLSRAGAVDIVGTIGRMVRAQRGGPVSVGDVAAACGCAPRTLRDRFRRSGHGSVKGWIDHQRAILSQEQLRYSDATISSIAEDMGFSDLYAFSRFFRRVTGMSPSAFRRQAVVHDRQRRLHG